MSSPLSEEAGPSKPSVPTASEEQRDSERWPTSNRILVLSLDGLSLPALERAVQSITGGEAGPADRGEDDPEEESIGPLAERSGTGSDGEETDGAASFTTYRAVQQDDHSQGPSDTTGAFIPWTISNRYYTANVHFQSLSLKSSGSRRPARRAEAPSVPDEGLAVLGQAMQGVTAIVLVVPSQGPLEAHRSRLERLAKATDSIAGEVLEGVDMPLGFDLAVSVVVGLPDASVPLEVNGSRRPVRGPDASSEELADLYAEQGWEYIDLALDDMDETSSSSSSSSADDDAADPEQEGARQNSMESGAQGLSRVKDALEANLWAGMKRQDQGRADARSASLTANSEDEPSGNGGSDLTNEDTALERMLRNLDLSMSAQDEKRGDESISGLISSERDPALFTADPNAPSAFEGVQTTAEDEEMARRFLAQIAQFEGREKPNRADRGEETAGASAHNEKTTLPESPEERRRNQTEALQRLEEFLQSEDPTWLGVSGAGRPMKPSEASSTEWRETSGQDGFEDDFDDFVKGMGDTSAVSEQTATNDDFDDFDGDDDDDFRPDNPNFRGTSRVEAIDSKLGASLAEVQAESARVQGMSGSQASKEQEAEKVVREMLEKWDLG